LKYIGRSDHIGKWSHGRTNVTCRTPKHLLAKAVFINIRQTDRGQTITLLAVTRPTQPFILSGYNVSLGRRHLVNAYEVKADIGVIAGNTV